MAKLDWARDYFEWCKQKSAEFERTLGGLNKSTEALTADARRQAEAAIARLRAACDAFRARVDAARSDAGSTKAVTDQALAAISARWSDVESAFQDFLAAASGKANIVEKALSDRAEAQRQSWRSFLLAVGRNCTTDKARAPVAADDADARSGASVAAEMTTGDRRPAPVRVSCVVCAYNEAARIRHILDAVNGHPALAEVIVVNDGSTDGTQRVLDEYPNIRVLSYSPNRGKTYALGQGIAAASGDYLMLLDADLAGITAADVQLLVDPVIRGEAEVSISLRGNSLAPYRWIGLDYVSGERVIPTRLVDKAVKAMEHLPRWGGEEFINDLIIEEGLSIAVVDWPTVFNTPKSTKHGLWSGTIAELEMIRDAVGFLSPLGVVRQNLALLTLVRAGARGRAARATE